MNKIFFTVAINFVLTFSKRIGRRNIYINIYINHRGYDINNFNRRFLELFIELLLQ